MKISVLLLICCCGIIIGCSVRPNKPDVYKTKDTLANTLFQKANLMQISMPDSSIVIFRICVEKYKESDSVSRVLDCYCKLTHISCFFLNQPENGEQYADSAKLFAQRDTSIQYKALYAQGIFRMKVEEYDTSTSLLLRALKMSYQKKDSIYAQTIAGLLSNIYFIQKKYKLALEYYQPVLAKAEQSAKTSMDVIAYINAYCFANEIPNRDSSIKYLSKALEIANKVKDSSVYTILYYNIGMYYKDNQMYDSALHYTKLAVEHISPNFAPLLKPEKPYLLYTEIYTSQQSYTKALELFKLVHLKADTATFEKSDKEYYYKMGYIIFEHFNKQAEALYYLKNFQQLQAQRHEVELSDQILNFEKEFKKLSAEKTILKKDSEIRRQKSYNYILAGALILLAVLIVFVYLEVQRRRKIQHLKLMQIQKEKELQQEKELLKVQIEERNRISQEMHDDLGSTLTTVHMGLNLLQNEPGNTAYLHIIDKATSTLSDQINEAIWNLNVKNDTLFSLIGFFKQFARDFLVNTDVTLHLNQESIANDMPITGIIRRSLYLILKELLNNTVKYAHAKNVYFDFEFDGIMLDILVKDDGIGFDITKTIASPGRGNGIINLTNTINKLGGKIDWKKNKGTEVRIQLALK